TDNSSIGWRRDVCRCDSGNLRATANKVMACILRVHRIARPTSRAAAECYYDSGHAPSDNAMSAPHHEFQATLGPLHNQSGHYCGMNKDAGERLSPYLSPHVCA